MFESSVISELSLAGAHTGHRLCPEETPAWSHCGVFSLLLSPAASCVLPFLAHLHQELLRSEKTSRASPSPPSRKLQTVTHGQLSSPCRVAKLPGTQKQQERVKYSTSTSPDKSGSRYGSGTIMPLKGKCQSLARR